MASKELSSFPAGILIIKLEKLIAATIFFLKVTLMSRQKDSYNLSFCCYQFSFCEENSNGL